MEGRHLHVLTTGLTNVGKVRRHNEDNFLLRRDLGVFLVSDGMGGHNAGEVASALTVASIRNFFEATSIDDYIEEDADEGAAAVRRLKAAVVKANHDVHEISTTHSKHRGMGCTLVMLYLQSPLIHIVHLGDSRCYRVRDKKIEQLTRDHNLLSDILALNPDIPSDDLAHLPKNIVTRSIGTEASVRIDTRSEEILSGDTFLLCSDGLTGMVSDHEIADIIEKSNDLEQAASRLIQAANDAGGTDNISTVLVRFEWREEETLPAPPTPPTDPEQPQDSASSKSMDVP